MIIQISFIFIINIHKNNNCSDASAGTKSIIDPNEFPSITASKVKVVEVSLFLLSFTQWTNN